MKISIPYVGKDEKMIENAAKATSQTPYSFIKSAGLERAQKVLSGESEPPALSSSPPKSEVHRLQKIEDMLRLILIVQGASKTELSQVKRLVVAMCKEFK